ncbi:redox-sensing transcriptional repressor [Anaerotaenia torta]|uniref:redox-sensing transcriptional repressor Rex n=1 Tax=Anaerotaenia torta TaxID=433293 RepID=UPI003D1EE4B0
MIYKGISSQALRRLPVYLRLLKALPEAGETGGANISATMIAHELKLNDVQVRKDLALVSQGGRPRTGYEIKRLIADIEHCLGYDNADSAVIVGAGNLGLALLSYEGFEEYGLDIVAAFDRRESRLGSVRSGKQIYALEKLPGLCSRMKINIGIITVEAEEAQSTCDLLVESGVSAVWNFAPVHLTVPEHVLVQNENLAGSLAVLSKQLAKKLTI